MRNENTRGDAVTGRAARQDIMRDGTDGTCQLRTDFLTRRKLSVTMPFTIRNLFARSLRKASTRRRSSVERQAILNVNAQSGADDIGFSSLFETPQTIILNTIRQRRRRCPLALGHQQMIPLDRHSLDTRVPPVAPAVTPKTWPSRAR